MLLVMVEDNGIGITEENQRKLFQPFKQAQRSAGGTGLGLFSLAKRIEALEGTCGVRDRADGRQGSVFWFTFPYRPDVAALEEHEVMLSGKRGSSGDPTQRSGGNGTPGRALPQLRVLLTDDSPAILKVTTRFLEKAGHVVETADNGNQSLERLKVARADFDILITDLQMPVMDGFESVRRFREFEKEHISGAALMIIGMSAKADEITVSEALASGMDLFVTKPFRYESLVELLRGSRLLDELGEVAGRRGPVRPVLALGTDETRLPPVSQVVQTDDVDDDAGAGRGLAKVAVVAAAAASSSSKGDVRDEKEAPASEEDDLVQAEAREKPAGRLPPIK